MEQQKSIFQSKNFWTSIITIIVGFLTANNLNLGLTPDQLVNGISGHNTVEILMFLVPALIVPIQKIAAQKTWDFSFFKSTNFWAQATTVLSVVLGFYFGEVTAGLIVAVVVQVVNLITHLSNSKPNIPA